MSYFLNFAEINLEYLHENLEALLELISTHDVRVIAMVKANAYGHGAVSIAQSLSAKVAAFGVATVEEGLKLRQAGIKNDILVFSGFCHPLQLMQIKQEKLIPIIHSEYHYHLLKGDIFARKLPVWVQVNTGMNQLGLSPDQFETVYNELAVVNVNINLITHFAEADSIDPSFTLHQLKRFNEMIQDKKLNNISATNSAGAMRFFDDSYMNTIRPGIALYGINPMNQINDCLKPIMSFKARIISLRTLDINEPIGYGRSYITDKKTIVATIAAGYGDGYPRHAPTGTPVLIHGHRCRLIGRVSMDVLTVDVTEIAAKVKIGDVVTLWGEGLHINEIAQAADTIAYTLTTGVTDRVKRIYLNAKYL